MRLARYALPASFMTALALLAAGCGGSGGSSATSTTTPTRSTTTTSATRTTRGADIEAQLVVSVQAPGTGVPESTITVACPPDHFANNAVRDACDLVAATPQVPDPYVVAPTAGACAATGRGPQRATINGTLGTQVVRTTYDRA
ncbi:MAG: hypothetical protein H7287_00575, partial [Thermoleophilia bacterium]|nr:hypothetical protein [Thermoleophilia bacterium]